MDSGITLEEAKKALGDEAFGLTDSQIMQVVADVEILVKQWSENFQKSLFDGKTINDLTTSMEGII